MNWPLNHFIGHATCCSGLHPWILTVPKLGMSTMSFIGDVPSDMLHGGGIYMLHHFLLI